MEAAEIIWGLVGVAVGALLSAATYFALRPWKQRDSAIEHAMQERLDEANTLRQMLNELDHCVNHVDGGDLETYVPRGEEFVAKARKASRAGSLGDGVRKSVIDYTDLVSERLRIAQQGEDVAALDAEGTPLGIRINQGRHLAWESIDQDLTTIPSVSGVSKR